MLYGKLVTLRPTTPDDVGALATIRATPEVHVRWLGAADPAGLAEEIAEDLDDPDVHRLAIEFEGRVVGMIQWNEEDDPQYRHAGVDLFLDPSVHGRGLGTDAVRTVCRYLLRERGHHRLVIDPAADNEAAIRTYAKVGFRAVGVMREYELGNDGTFHDGLLMDLLAEDFDE